MIPAEAFALACGFFTAVNLIFLKKGLAHGNPISATVLSLAINVLSFWSFVLAVLPWDEILRPELLIFVLVGLIQPGGTRFLAYLSVEKVGVAVTAPLRATTPLFSSLLAIAVLGEQLTPSVGAGTALVVGGITLLSLSEEKTGGWMNVLVALPLLSAFVAGSTQVIRKIGLAGISLPILGAATTTGTSLVAIAVSLTVSRNWSMVRFHRRALGYFILAGCSVTLGVASIFMSLHLSDVVIVAPLASLSPLYSLVLSAVFLRDVEVITARKVVAAGLIVVGVVLITAIR
ncbi:MAG: DMT family transporter [Deltaproteobacteria bacterium]|nr:DMT family transporter [Deltaproteobacteria bacterium]MDE0213370.1 DMT family transporter [Deltaproteobacteria bacterium]